MVAVLEEGHAMLGENPLDGRDRRTPGVPGVLFDRLQGGLRNLRLTAKVSLLPPQERASGSDLSPLHSGWDIARFLIFHKFSLVHSNYRLRNHLIVCIFQNIKRFIRALWWFKMATIEEVVAAKNFGRPSAVKRGRFPHRPYVAVVYEPHGPSREFQRTIKGFAFPTREEAVAFAQKCIDGWREHFREELGQRGARALRARYGLPIEIR